MRTVVACVLLAAAVTVPGIVVRRLRHEAEIMQPGGPGRPCPVHVQITVVQKTSVEMWIEHPGCSDAVVRHGDLKVRYSPGSLGPAIRDALGTLPG